MNTLEMPSVAPPRVTWYEADEPPRRHSPRDRPPAGLRIMVGLLGFVSMLSAAALLLSDRAPGMLTTLFGDRARRLWARIDATERVDLPAAADIPPTDFLAHVAIWLVVTSLVGLAVWSWRGLVAGALILAGLSVALELAQGRYAAMRSVQASDALANLIGVSVGVAVVVVSYVTWTAIASVVRWVRHTMA